MAEAEQERMPIDAKGVALFAIPFAAATIAGYVGAALFPTLLKNAPLLLIFLNPKLRNFLAVSPSTDFAPFFAVAVLRLMLLDPVWFLFGRRYGDVTIRWMDRRFGSAVLWITWLEKAFKRASWPVAFAFPNQWVCLLAGAAGMRASTFAILDIAGTVTYVLLIRWLGDTFADPILSITGWIGDNRLWLTGVTIVLVMISIVYSMRNRPKGAIETPSEMAEELEELEEELE